eukprot:8907949-Ditylum_brightwellii.AAC.1
MEVLGQDNQNHHQTKKLNYMYHPWLWYNYLEKSKAEVENTPFPGGVDDDDSSAIGIADNKQKKNTKQNEDEGYLNLKQKDTIWPWGWA